MPTFNYRAITPQGQVVRNKMDDASKLSCIKRLKRNGLTPISVQQTINVSRKSNSDKNKSKKPTINKDFLNTARIKQKKAEKTSFIEKMDKKLMAFEQITARDVRIFTQNFYLLKKANFNNIHALSTVIETTENQKLKVVLEDILSGVEAGEYMYTSMEYYSNVFPYIYVNMIKVGELSGALEEALQQAVKYLEDDNALKTKLKRILLPNLAMFIGLLVMLVVGVVLGVPLVQDVFDSLGTDTQLPPLTLWFADVVDLLIEYWYVPTSIVLGTVIGVMIYINTPRGRYYFDYFKYTMPIFGKLIYLIDFSRLMKNLLLNLQNGMRIQDSLEVCKNVVKNTVMLSMIETSINNIFIGKSWIDPFEESRLGDKMTIEMLKIGMQTDLPEMMTKLIIYMDIDIDNTMEKIVKILPEISYLCVGVVLIFFVLVILVPAISIYMGGFLFDAYDV